MNHSSIFSSSQIFLEGKKLLHFYAYNKEQED